VSEAGGASVLSEMLMIHTHCCHQSSRRVSSPVKADERIRGASCRPEKMQTKTHADRIAQIDKPMITDSKVPMSFNTLPVLVRLTRIQAAGYGL
jgi:hypothetical protein